MIVVHDEDAATDHLVALEELGLFDQRSHLAQSFQHVLDDGLPAVDKVRDRTRDLVARLDRFHVRHGRTSAHLERLYPEALLLGGGHVLAEQHVPQLGDGLPLVLLRRRCTRIDGDHLPVQILAQGRVRYLVFRERSEAHLDVHHVRIDEAVQQILQLDKVLAVGGLVHAEELGPDLGRVRVQREQAIGEHFGVRRTGDAFADDAVRNWSDAGEREREEKEYCYFFKVEMKRCDANVRCLSMSRCSWKSSNVLKTVRESANES